MLVAIAALTLLLGPAPTRRLERPLIELHRSTLCGSWYAAIYSSGVAHSIADDTCGNTDPSARGSLLRRVSARELSNLRKAIAVSRFREMPASIEPDANTVVADEDVLTIMAWVGGTRYLVGAFGLERMPKSESASRFKALWAAATAIAPDPIAK